MSNDQLIILCGMPRSGTTWLGKLFDSHPDSLYLHEPDSVTPFTGIPLLVSANAGDAERQELRAFVEKLTESRSTKVCGSLPMFNKRYLGAVGHIWCRIAVLGAKLGSRVFGEFPVLAQLRPASAGKVYIAWKSIESVGRLGFFANALPEVRLVFEIRHPCGSIASVKRGEQQGRFSAQDSISNDYGLMTLLLDTDAARSRELTLEKLKASHPIERQAWQWLLFNEKALGELENCKNATLVRYEDLCAKPVEVTQRLFEFAGLSWNTQTEGFLASSTQGEKKDYYSVYKNPERAANKWKEELTEEEIKMVRDVVAGSRAGALYFDGPAI